MTNLLELLVSLLAVIGVYAVLSRVVVWFTPKEKLSIAILGEEESIESICRLAENVRLYTETDAEVESLPVVILETADAQKEDVLLAEGFLVYVRRT